MSGKSKSFVKDLAEDVAEYFTKDSPDNFAGRDINQDSSEKTTNIENLTQKGDIIEGDQSNTVIDTKNCEPESISVKEVDAPFWGKDIKTTDIKCKEDDQPEAYTKPELDPEPDPEPKPEPDPEPEAELTPEPESGVNDAPPSEPQDLGIQSPEPQFEFEWGG